jgi:FMN phosphatase YigB (HAD superfamily)
VFERLRPGFDFAAAAAERRRRGLEFRIEQRDLYADAHAGLTTLAGAGWFVGIAGNQPRSAKPTLATFGLGASLITTSAELGIDKPSLEFFSRILDMAGFRAEEALYVGDRVDNDVKPARAFGMTTILLERGPWGRNHARRAEAALADIRVPTLAALPDAIRHLRTA